MPNNTWIEKFRQKFYFDMPNHSFGWDEQDRDGMGQIIQFISELLEEQKCIIRKEVVEEIIEILPKVEGLLTVNFNPFLERNNFEAGKIVGAKNLSQEILEILNK